MGYIYKITHTDGRVYIGQTTLTTNQRWYRHQEDAKYHRRHFSHFLAAIQKYGTDCWKVETVECVPDEQLDEREIYWIAFYDSTDPTKGFNITPGGSRPPSRKGKEQSAEAKEKNRQAHLGRKLPPLKEETKEKISKAKKGVALSEEHKQALSEAWKTRPPRKPEQSEKVRVTSTGRINIKRYRVLSPDGIEYITERGMNEFCKEYGIYRTAMSLVAHGKKSEWHGWRVLGLAE